MAIMPKISLENSYIVTFVKYILTKIHENVRKMKQASEVDYSTRFIIHEA